MAKLLVSLTLTFLTPLVFGQCGLDPISGPAVGEIMTDTSLCLSQGAGSYTFGMYSTLTPGPFPLAAGGGRLNENANVWFTVMDNSCKVLG